jgi:hypothetical protein
MATQQETLDALVQQGFELQGNGVHKWIVPDEVELIFFFADKEHEAQPCVMAYYTDMAQAMDDGMEAILNQALEKRYEITPDTVELGSRQSYVAASITDFDSVPMSWILQVMQKLEADFKAYWEKDILDCNSLEKMAKRIFRNAKIRLLKDSESSGEQVSFSYWTNGVFVKTFMTPQTVKEGEEIWCGEECYFRFDEEIATVMPCFVPEPPKTAEEVPQGGWLLVFPNEESKQEIRVPVPTE